MPAAGYHTSRYRLFLYILDYLYLAILAYLRAGHTGGSHVRLIYETSATAMRIDHAHHCQFRTDQLSDTPVAHVDKETCKAKMSECCCHKTILV